jgi:hypothetical protein
MTPSRLSPFTWLGRVLAPIWRGHRPDLSPGPEPRHLLDALRRSTELLDGMRPVNGSDNWLEERDYIVAVNRRLLRTVDPEGLTDRAVR